MPATVNADLFRIAFNFASTEETRYYLNGVLIQKHQAEGVYLVATDGHRMMVIHDATGSTTLDDVIVRLDKAALAACKPNRKDQAERLLRVEGDGVAHVLEAYGDEMRPTAMCHGVIIDGTFPDWTRVARPNLEEKAPATFNAAYTATFATAARDLTREKNAAFSIIGTGANPALVRFYGVEHAYGIFMPLRFECPQDLPFFINAPSAEELAASKAQHQEAAE